MPAKHRRRPVVEEIVETPNREKRETHSRARHVQTEEVFDPDYTQTVKQVASYDEPPMVERSAAHIPLASHNPESAAQELLREMNQTSVERKPNMKLIFVITILTALIVGFIAGGVYVYISGVSETPSVVSKTPTPSPVSSVEPTATPKPVVKLDTLSVNILNGSGIIGAAGKVKSSLETAGFKVQGTANASNYGYKHTIIQVKESVTEEVVSAIKNALSGYIVEMGENLSTSSSYDIVVTAGRE